MATIRNNAAAALDPTEYRLALIGVGEALLSPSMPHPTTRSMVDISAPLNRRLHASSTMAEVIEEIEEKIREGVWLPGHRLPTERALEVRFGVARNTIRKGLKQLERDGKIVRHVGRGSFVADHPQRLSATPGLSERVMGASPSEIMEVRLMLEPHAAQLAALRASAADLARMDECLEQAAQAQDIARFEFWDGALHEAIIGSVRNDLLSGIYEAINSIRNQPEWRKLKERTVTPDDRAAYHEQHSQLVNVLRERDGDAARRLMRTHLLSVRNNLLDL